MRFKTPIKFLVLINFLGGMFLLLAGDTSKGRQIFEAKGCNACHAVSSVGIQAKNPPSKNQAPDLCGVGERFECEWITKYIKKEVKKGDQLHTSGFKGSDTELRALVDWLLEQKAEG